MNRITKRKIEVTYSLEDLFEAAETGWQKLQVFAESMFEHSFAGWKTRFDKTVAEDDNWQKGLKRALRYACILHPTRLAKAELWEKARDTARLMDGSLQSLIDKSFYYGLGDLTKDIRKALDDSADRFTLFLNMRKLIPKDVPESRIYSVQEVLESGKTSVSRDKEYCRQVIYGLENADERRSSFWKLVILELGRQTERLITIMSDEGVRESMGWWWLTYLINKACLKIERGKSRWDNRWRFVMHPDPGHMNRVDVTGFVNDVALGLLSVPAYSLASKLERGERGGSSGRKDIETVSELFTADYAAGGRGFEDELHMVQVAEEAGHEITGASTEHKKSNVHNAIAELVEQDWPIDRSAGYRLIALP